MRIIFFYCLITLMRDSVFNFKKHTVSIILNITFIAIFLGVFFFTYGVHVEEQIVKNSSIYIANTLKQDAKLLIPDSMYNEFVEKLIIPSPEQDENVVKNNNELLYKSSIVLGTIFIIGISTVYVLCNKWKINFWTITKESLIILFFVAITEFIFMTLVVANYMSADPNYVKYSVLTRLKKFLDIEQSTPLGISLANLNTFSQFYLKNEFRTI